MRPGEQVNPASFRGVNIWGEFAGLQGVLSYVYLSVFANAIFVALRNNRHPGQNFKTSEQTQDSLLSSISIQAYI